MLAPAMISLGHTQNMLWKLILIGFGFAAGDVLFKQWMLGGASFKKVGLLLYFAALIFFWASLTTQAFQLRTTNLSIAVVTPILVNIIAVSLMSYFYYREGLSVYQAVIYLHYSSLSPRQRSLSMRRRSLRFTASALSNRVSLSVTSSTLLRTWFLSPFSRTSLATFPQCSP